jgi:hypothetical protein
MPILTKVSTQPPGMQGLVSAPARALVLGLVEHMR